MGCMIDWLENQVFERYWDFSLVIEPTKNIIAIDSQTETQCGVLVRVDPRAEELLSQQGFSPEEQRLLAKGLVKHAYGRLYQCPGNDVLQKGTMLQAIAGVVEKRMKGQPLEEQEAVIGRLAFRISNTILDAMLALEENEPWYADAIALNDKKVLLAATHLSLEEELFFRIRLSLFGGQSKYTNDLVKLLSDKGTNVPDLPDLVKKALNCFNGRENTVSLLSFLRPPAHWPDLAKSLTAVLFKSPLIYREIKQTASSRSTQGTAGGYGASERVLTTLYNAKAKEIELRLNSGTAGKEEHPIAPLVIKPVDARFMPPLKDINWSRTLVLPEKEANGYRLQLYWNEHYTPTPVKRVDCKGAFPDLSFWVDSSRSMTYYPLKQKGKYHQLLLAVFGVLQWLEKTGYANNLSYSVLNFSDVTLYSGWRTWTERPALNDVLFNRQGGNTNLDVNVIEQLVKEAHRFFTVILVTDGELNNGEEVCKCLNTYFGQSKNVIMIQIGKESKFSRQLSTQGFEVHKIGSAQDLGPSVLDGITDRYV